MKQQCHVLFVYASWLILLGGLIFFLLEANILKALLWVIFIALFMWLYVRYFPAVSRFMGYGSVEDRPAENVQPSGARVTLYTGLGCPFCPLVKRRLKELQTKMGFQLYETDVTLKPDLLIAKGIRALPVIEVGHARWVGNATSDQLARFVEGNAVQQEVASHP